MKGRCHHVGDVGVPTSLGWHADDLSEIGALRDVARAARGTRHSTCNRAWEYARYADKSSDSAERHLSEHRQEVLLHVPG